MPVVGFVPFQSPPIDVGAGEGFFGYLEFGNNLWNPEYILSGSAGTAQAKKEALEAVGIAVGTTPTEVAELVSRH